MRDGARTGWPVYRSIPAQTTPYVPLPSGLVTSYLQRHAGRKPLSSRCRAGKDRQKGFHTVCHNARSQFGMLGLPCFYDSLAFRGDLDGRVDGPSLGSDGIGGRLCKREVAEPTDDCDRTASSHSTS